MTGHDGMTATADRDFTAHFILPDGTESTFDFTIDPNSPFSCDNPTITPPTFTASHVYNVGDVAASYDFPDFTVDGGCSIDSYMSTVVGATLATDTSFFTDLST